MTVEAQKHHQTESADYWRRRCLRAEDEAYRARRSVARLLIEGCPRCAGRRRKTSAMEVVYGVGRAAVATGRVVRRILRREGGRRE